MENIIVENNVHIEFSGEENGFSSPMLIFAAIMTILIMIIGIIGNFLTVAALINCPKVRNVAAAFIMSLCIADLLFCALVLPFSAYRFIQGTWTPGEFLCKMIPFIQYGNIGVSLLCIAMITINRYVMIAHHSSYDKIYKRHWIAAMIIFCWVFSYGMQLPTLVGAWGTFDYDPKLGTCSIMTDDYGRSSKAALFITAFIIPCIIIIACYAKIFWVVHQSERRMKHHAKKQNSMPNNLRVINSSNIELGNCQSRTSSAESSSFSTDVKQEVIQKQSPSRIKDQREVRAKRNEWRITKMVLAIFLSFVVCYLPITIVKVADQDVMHPNFHILSYIMLYMSACLNPIIYVIMNKQYRKAYKTVLMCDIERLFKCRDQRKSNNKGEPAGSSVAEKWKDTELNHNHSRTCVSQISASDHLNINFNGLSPVMMVAPPIMLPKVNVNYSIKEPMAAVKKPVFILTKLPELATNEEINFEMMTIKEATIQKEHQLSNHNNSDNSHPCQASNSLHQIEESKVKNNNNNNQTKEPNCIALVGGDIIFEEEEEDMEEAIEQILENNTKKRNDLPAVNQHQKITHEQIVRSLRKTKLEPVAELLETPTTPPLQEPVCQKNIRPPSTPLYVNASVLHLFYGQNTHDIQDNENNANNKKKLLDKPKLGNL